MAGDEPHHAGGGPLRRYERGAVRLLHARAYRGDPSPAHGHRASGERRDAVTPSAGALRGLGRLAMLEIRLYVALVRWCARRKDVPATAQPWPYAALAAPLLWLWIFGSATEVVVFHLIIPWETVRIVVDI